MGNGGDWSRQNAFVPDLLWSLLDDASRLLGALWLFRGSLQNVVCAILFVVAFVKGDAPERILASSLLATPIAVFTYRMVLGGVGVYQNVDLGLVAIDLALFAVIWWVALRANRIYPLWLGGAQLVSVLGHLYRFAIVKIQPMAYAVMIRMPFYVLLLAMSIGLAFHIARKRRIGSYPSWRASSVRSAAGQTRMTPAV